jgi:hypothetical protein
MNESCWFCKIGTADRASSFNAPLYRDAQWFSSRKGNTVTQEVRYIPGKVAVPRCVLCASKHRKQSYSALACAGIALIAWLVLLCVAPPEWRNVFAFAWGSILAAGLGAGIGFILGIVLFRTGRAGSAQQYPGVVAMLSQGWVYGAPDPSRTRLQASVQARKQRQGDSSRN